MKKCVLFYMILSFLTLSALLGSHTPKTFSGLKSGKARLPVPNAVTSGGGAAALGEPVWFLVTFI